MSFGTEDYVNPAILILLTVLDQAVKSFPEVEIITKLFVLVGLSLQIVYFSLKITAMNKEEAKERQRSASQASNKNEDER